MFLVQYSSIIEHPLIDLGQAVWVIRHSPLAYAGINPVHKVSQSNAQRFAVAANAR
jgi:hypothetical protein